MKRHVLAGVAVLVFLGGMSYAAVELVPYRIEETRVAQLVKDDIGRTADSLKVTFSLKGPEAADAAKYGALKIEEAVDDKGTKLIPSKEDPFNNAAKFKEFSNAFFEKMNRENKRPVGAPQIEMDLKSPARAATKIARLKGFFSISSEGTIKSVEAAGLKPGDKKKLDVPANAGLTITVNIKAEKEVNEIGIDMVGDEDALNSLEVVDAAGNSVSGGMSSWSMGDKVERSIMLQSRWTRR